jgi:uncharacterized membrane protein YgcG
MPAMAAGAGTASSTIQTDVEDFTFTSYTADYYLSRDDEGASRLLTEETFVAQFPDFDQNRGIIRAIPNDYDGVDLDVEVQSVTDANGSPVQYEEERSGGFVELALGTDDYVRGSQTYTITYEQTNVVRAFEDTGVDEFYWDTNGTGFNQPFGEVNASVHIDPALEDALTGANACYVGGQGSTEQCGISQGEDANGTVFNARGVDLGPGENVTVAIAFTAGTFDVPQPPKPAAWAILAPIALMIATAIAAVGALIARALAGRGHAGRGTIIPQYSVPDDINLLLAGDLVQRDSKALAAELVSLAVRGNIFITEIGDEYTLHFVTNHGVDEQEQSLLVVLFGSTPKQGKTRRLTGAPANFGTSVRAVTKGSREIAVRRGLRKKVISKAAKIWAVILGVLLLASGLVAFLNLVLSPVPSVWGFLVAATGVIGAIVAGIALSSASPLTELGAEKRDYIEGLRVYTKLAEEERFRMLQSPDGALRVDVGDVDQVIKVYENLLPFAILWGVEDEWSKELAIQYRNETPEWYVGSRGFNPIVFGAAMHSFSNATTTSITPVYSGSGGGSSFGGSGGGGFSGGGGGGGGGGGR